MQRLIVSTLAGLLGIAAASGVAHAQDIQPVPYGAIYDHGYVRFSLDNYQEQVDGVFVDRGYSLKARGRVVGAGVPRGSALLYRLKQGQTDLGRLRCEVGTQSYDVVAPWHETQRCQDRDQRITAEGEVTVEVFFVDGDSDAETLVARHRLQILQVTRVRGTGQADATQHYINQNGEVARAIINRIPMNMTGYEGGSRNGSTNRVELFIVAAPKKWNTPDQAGPSLHSSQNRLRCSVNGERVRIDRDQVTGSDDNVALAIHTFAQGRRDERQLASSRVIHYQLPISWGEHRINDNPALDDHPGRWSCEIRQNGDIIRSFAFTVNADGTIAPHAEETAGFTLGLGAHLVDVSIPADSAFETRIDPDSVRRMGIGYGHVMNTAEGQAMIAALPTLGTPFLPQPAPPAAASAGRGGRGGTRRRGR